MTHTVSVAQFTLCDGSTDLSPLSHSFLFQSSLLTAVWTAVYDIIRRAWRPSTLISNSLIYCFVSQTEPPCTALSCSANSATRTWSFGWPAKSTRTLNRKRWPPKPRRSTMTLSQSRHPKKWVDLLSPPNSIRSFWLTLCAFEWFPQVNLDAETRLITLTNVQSNNPDPHAFDRAQRRIQHMMERDSYLRFLQSELFLELIHPERYPTSSVEVSDKSSSAPWNLKKKKLKKSRRYKQTNGTLWAEREIGGPSPLSRLRHKRF